MEKNKKSELLNKVIFNLNEILYEINVPASGKFNYMLKKNKDIFKKILKKKPTFTIDHPDYQTFTKNTQEKIKEEKITFKSTEEINKYFEEEIAKYPEIAKIRAASVEDFKKAIQKWEMEAVEVELYKVSISNFPDGLTSEQFEIFSDYFDIDREDEVEESE